MAKYEELCTQILENVGGKENITSAVHCMTRLRINYKEYALNRVFLVIHLISLVLIMHRII